MPKRAFYALCLAVLVVCLVPYHRGAVSAYQDNLWTAAGWGNASPQPVPMEPQTWNRTQYGIHWAWLVVDREVGGEAWFARVEPRALLAYGALPVTMLAGACLLERRRKPFQSR